MYTLIIKDEWHLPKPDCKIEASVEPKGIITVAHDLGNNPVEEIIGKTEPEDIEEYLFNLSEPVIIDGTEIVQLALKPKQYVNNPEWSFQDMLNNECAVNVTYLSPNKHLLPGEYCEQKDRVFIADGKLFK